MPNRLVDAVSPYLRSHSDNPVDWREWGPEPFADAAERDVPVLVSIGYSTCHWCHVMARESFSDPELAAHLNERFVPIKVDREEYPDVDASYLAAARAFTPNLGWPLNVFVTPAGRTFFAGTYFPPEAVQGHPSFRSVLDAVTDAWTSRRTEVESNGEAIASALAASTAQPTGALPDSAAFGRIVRELVGYEDAEHGGFGAAPKFPVAPVLTMLLDRGSLAGAPESEAPAGDTGIGQTAAGARGAGDADAAELAIRTLDAMAASDLRDDVEGGFFRYSTRRDWTDPHYERMLYDNAQLLALYARVPGGEEIAAGIADFLGSVMRLPSGAFASAQDSESMVDGERVEGGYYALDAADRARQHPPALDEKVLTGWNGLAIEALADAGSRLSRSDWVELARGAADHLLAAHLWQDGRLVRASVGPTVSAATATLEDYGMFANGLLALALATGEVHYAVAARSLVDATMGTDAAGGSNTTLPFRVPGGGDPVLESQGLLLEVDPSEGAYPSGVSATAGAAHTLYLLTGDRGYLDAAVRAMRALAPSAEPQPISFGASLSVMTRITASVEQLVVVTSDAASDDLITTARQWDRAGAVTAVVTEAQARSLAAAGFELFEGRVPQGGAASAYLCRDFVCRLPITNATELEHELATRSS